MVFVVNGTVTVSILDGLLTGREFTIDGSELNDFQSRCLCAYNEDGRHKLNFDKAFRRSIRRLNDEISIKYGLPVLEEHAMYRPDNTEHDEQRIRTKHGHTIMTARATKTLTASSQAIFFTSINFFLLFNS